VGAQQNRREKKSVRKARNEAVRVTIIIIVGQVLQTSLEFGALMFVCLVVLHREKAVLLRGCQGRCSQVLQHVTKAPLEHLTLQLCPRDGSRFALEQEEHLCSQTTGKNPQGMHAHMNVHGADLFLC
jgi:hypothetical protein